MKKFEENWSPTLMSQEILAQGTWWYQGVKTFNVELLKQKYDYTSKDLVVLEEEDDRIGLDWDAIDYRISDEGTLYKWKFRRGEEITFSDSFSTYFLAREHIDSYEGKKEIIWNS